MLFHFIHLKNTPIFEQLVLEEFLLRERTENFCLINQGSPPAIVMGISGKPHELIDKEKAIHLGCPVIKRFSGGGTVFIDSNTLFVSFICNKNAFSFPGYPERIMRWTETLYQEALELPGFALKENDFVIGEHKCGGNAQYITKERFIQHTSFLWDFSKEHMKSLLHPRKTPSYRQGRDHEQFLCTLKDHLPQKDTFFKKIEEYLRQKYIVKEEPYQKVESLEKIRISTCFIDLNIEVLS